jgi:hypothetical protein
VGRPVTQKQREPVDPTLVTWERLFKLMRGSADVVEALLPVAAGLTRDELARLLARAGSWREGMPQDALEQVWRLLGVTPRYRYDELLRRYETLRGRVEEAEAGIRELRREMAIANRETVNRDALDSWGELVRRTLAAQAGLVRSVTGLDSPPAPKPDPKPRAPRSPARRRTPRS